MTSSPYHHDFSPSFRVLNMSITFSKLLLTTVLFPTLLTIIFPLWYLFDNLARRSKHKTITMEHFSFNRIFSVIRLSSLWNRSFLLSGDSSNKIPYEQLYWIVFLLNNISSKESCMSAQPALKHLDTKLRLEREGDNNPNTTCGPIWMLLFQPYFISQRKITE